MEIGSTPEKGSSSSKNAGEVANALAISTFLRSPPDRTEAIDFRKCVIEKTSKSSFNLSAI